MISNSLVPFTACSTFLENEACLEQASEEVNTITATLNQTERPAVINQLARHTLNFFNNEAHTELLSDKLQETNNTKLYDAFGALSYSFSTFKEASAQQAMQQIETVLKQKKDYAIPDEETLKIVPLKEWFSAGWYLDPTLATKTENLASLIDAAAIPCVRTCTHDVRINMSKLKTPSSISPAQVVYFARLILEYLNHYSLSLALSHRCQAFATELTREINSNSDQNNAIKLLDNMKQLEKAFDLPLTQETRSKIRKIIDGVHIDAGKNKKNKNIMV